MSLDQERAWPETVNNEDSILHAPHHEVEVADLELAQPADLLIDLQPEYLEAGSFVQEDSNLELGKEGDPKGKDADSDWDMDVTSEEYENVNKRAKRRHVEVTFDVLKPTEDQRHVGVTDRREIEAKEREKRKKRLIEANAENLEKKLEAIDKNVKELEHPWEARLWVNNVVLDEREKKGLQIFLGNYNTKKQAQDAHDMAAIFFKKVAAGGKNYILNFPASEQAERMAKFHDWLVRDFTWLLRRHCDSFTRSEVELRGVSQKTLRGKQWFEARISYTDTAKHEYLLGRFATKEEAGRAYDLALLYCHRHEGAAIIINHVITNYQPSQYTNAEIREVGKKLDPKPKSRREVRELMREMHKKRKRLDH